MAGRHERRTAPADPARRRLSPRRLRRTGRKSSRAPRGVHVVEPRGDVRRHRTGQAYFGRLGHRLHLESLCPGTPSLRRGPRRGLRHEPQFRTARRHAPRPHAALRRDGRKHHRHGQTPRTGHPLYIYRRLHGRIPAGQGRMAGPRGRALRPARGRGRHAATDRPGLPGPESTPRPGCTAPEGDAQHPLPRHLVPALIAELHDPPDRGCRRGVRLHEERFGHVGGRRHGGGLPAGQRRRFLAQRRSLQHAGGTDGPEPEIFRHSGRAQPERLQQQPPPNPGRRFRLLGIGRRTPRPRAARPADDLLGRQRPDLLLQTPRIR